MSVSLSAIRAYRLEMLLIFIIIVSVGTIITCTQTPVFEVNSRIIVHDEGIASSQKPKQGENGKAALGAIKGKDTTFNTAIEVLQGNIMAEQVITSLGVTQLFPDFADDTQEREHLLRLSFDKFQKQLTVRPVNGTRIIRISFRHHKPEIAVQVVNTLIELFEKQGESMITSQIPKIPSAEELLLLYRNLQQAKQALSMFENNNRMYTSFRSKENIAVQYSKTQSLLAAEKEKLKELEDKVDSLEQQFADVFNSADNELNLEIAKDFEDDRAAFLQLKLYEYELIRKYGEGEQLITNVRRQLAMIKNNFPEKDEKIETMADQIVLAKTTLSRLKEKTGFIQRQLSQLENKSGMFEEREKVLKQLRAEVENKQALYAKFVQQAEKGQAPAGTSSYVSIIEKPMVPLKPIKPKKMRNLCLSIFLGLLCSLLYALGRQAWSGGAVKA